MPHASIMAHEAPPAFKQSQAQRLRLEADYAWYRRTLQTHRFALPGDRTQVRFETVILTFPLLLGRLDAGKDGFSLSVGRAAKANIATLIKVGAMLGTA